jgi:DUF1009 family protein
MNINKANITKAKGQRLVPDGLHEIIGDGMVMMCVFGCHLGTISHSTGFSKANLLADYLPLTHPKAIPCPAAPKAGVLGLVAGFGDLPVSVAAQAMAWGWPVVVFSIHKDNRKELKALGSTVIPISPGLLDENFSLAKQHGVTHGVFAGKVNKWQLLANPKLDKRAIDAFNTLRQRSDDQVMEAIIQLIEDEGYTVLAQTDFLFQHFLPAGHIAGPPLTATQQNDVAYGWQLAKGMGGMDVGQSVVVHKGMAIAIEAIEGTDACIKRAGKWAQNHWFKASSAGTVVKVAKPQQDMRFDVPTVGLKTLKAMKKAGLNVLAAEANETFFLDPEVMTAYANRHNITIVACEDGQCPQ